MAENRLVTLDRALGDKHLLGAALGNSATWRVWHSCLKAAYAEPLTDDEREAFASVAGGRNPPERKVKEFVAAISRRAGKGRMAAGLAIYEAILVDHSKRLAPGETGVVACISPTQAQARIVQRYCVGYLEASPILRSEVAEVTADEIRLRNGNVITTLTSDYRTLRGRTLLLAILDEASFLRDDTSTMPDIEAARALLPGLSTTRGMLVILSSPYRRAGLLFQRHRDFFGEDGDRVLVVAGSSAQFNPTLDMEQIDAERANDPEGASAEYDGQFRRDSASFLDEASIEAAIDRSRPLELGPQSGIVYKAFTDPSGGVGQDAYTLAIAHREGQNSILDVVRGTVGKINPNEVTHEYAALCREYRIATVVGDAYGREWVEAAWRGTGITYRKSELAKSDIYLEVIPMFTRGLVRLPEHPKLLRELRLLQRKPHPSGRDTVDHPRNAHDDFANAMCGALRLVGAARQMMTAAGMTQLMTALAELPRRNPDSTENDPPGSRTHRRDC
jgi:hypothetical protein